jgi:hypothetical protein
MVCLACAYTLCAPANAATGAVVNVSPATTLRLVMEVEIAFVMVISVVMGLVN